MVWRTASNQPVGAHRAVQHLLQPALALCRLQQQHQVGRGGEAHPPATLRRQVAQRDRHMGLANARWPQQHHVLGPLDEGQAGQFLDLSTAVEFQASVSVTKQATGSSALC